MSEYVYIDRGNSRYIQEQDETSKTIIPYIHRNGKNYLGEKIVRDNVNNLKDKVKQIQKRYYDKMFNQVKNLVNQDAKKLLEIISSPEEFIDAIEQQTAKKFNDNANNNMSAIQSFNEAVNNLKKALKEPNEIDEAFFKLIQTMFNANDETMQKLWQILNNGENVTQLFSKELINISGMYAAIKNFKNTGKSLNYQWLSSVLSAPSEAMAAMTAMGADSIASVADKEILKGTQINNNTKIKYSGDDLITTVIDKGVDFQIQGANVTIPYSIVSSSKEKEKIELSLKYDLTNFYSVKNYISQRKNSDINLISHGGTHSFAIEVFKRAFPEKEYAIYNAMAIRQNVNSTIDDNFRILREDLILNFAEQFISGFGENNLQSVFVSNFKAYPVGALICAMAADMEKFLDEGKYIGSSGSLFTIAFNKTGIAANNKANDITSNLQKAFVRSKKLKEKIDKIGFQGKLNGKALESVKDMLNQNLDLGIKLT